MLHTAGARTQGSHKVWWWSREYIQKISDKLTFTEPLPLAHLQPASSDPMCDTCQSCPSWFSIFLLDKMCEKYQCPPQIWTLSARRYPEYRCLTADLSSSLAQDSRLTAKLTAVRFHSTVSIFIRWLGLQNAQHINQTPGVSTVCLSSH